MCRGLIPILQLTQDCANSNEENPPNITEVDSGSPEIERELETASSHELDTTFDNNDPLDHGKVITDITSYGNSP